MKRRNSSSQMQFQVRIRNDLFTSPWRWTLGLVTAGGWDRLALILLKCHNSMESFSSHWFSHEHVTDWKLNSLHRLFLILFLYFPLLIIYQDIFCFYAPKNFNIKHSSGSSSHKLTAKTYLFTLGILLLLTFTFRIL